jgi:hypothetical protein
LNQACPASSSRNSTKRFRARHASAQLRLDLRSLPKCAYGDKFPLIGFVKILEVAALYLGNREGKEHHYMGEVGGRVTYGC